MPELPEVEVTRRGVQDAVVGRVVRDVLTHVPRLRWPIPVDLRDTLVGRTVLAARRRGKYLLLEFEHGWLIVHLGMSGSLVTVERGRPRRAHDHVEIVFDDRSLRLHDPRRFGAVLWHDRDTGEPARHPLMARLGVEPLEPGFDGALLHAATRGRRVSIKQALLAGGIVVGVGNIYASESLFRAGIRPTLAAGRIGRARCDALATAIRETLAQAIDRGGSSLRDFVGTDGETGHFQLDCFVYGRAGEPCRVCGTPIRAIRQQGRSTFHCPRCQR